jgi:D-tyrosyl-tRNA(Tyr) deacylase
MELIGLLQRVTSGRVDVGGRVVGQIGRGLVVLLAVEKGDGPAQAERLVERLAGYRVFPDAQDRMNLSVTEIGGELLLVPQFTLAADTDKGLRPSFTAAAAPEQGKALFALAVELAERRLPGKVAVGQFGADMQVSLTNDGPVTFWLQVPSASGETG